MNRRVLAIFLFIALAVWATFGRATANEFISWDDELLITHNPRITDPTLSNLEWIWTHPHEDLFIPVVYTAWWTLAHLGGQPDPVIFHAANVALHLFNAWLVFLILRLLLRKDWPAFAGALLFALHPLQVEAVASATGTKDVLSGFLSLTALWFYLLAASRDRRGVYYAAATGLFILALLAKPMAVVLPLMAATLDFLILGRPWKRVAAWTLPWLIPAAAIAIVATIVQPSPQADAGPILARPLVAADAIAFYLFKLFYPAQLGLDYGRTPSAVLHMHIVGLPWLAIVWIFPAVALILLARLRCRVLLSAGAVFIIALLPVLGFVKFNFQAYSTVADRFMYLAMLGPALVLGQLCNGSIVRTILISAVLAVLAIRSFVQIAYWHDSELFWRHVIAVNPDSYLGHNNLGVVLASRGDAAGAIEQYERAIDLRPLSPPEYRYIADFNTLLGDPKTGADYARRLLNIQPELDASARGDPAELHAWAAQHDLQWADSARSHGSIEEAKQAYELAIADSRTALQLKSTNINARQTLASAETSLKALTVPR